MEKIVCALWSDGEDRAEYGRGLLTALPPALAETGARHIRLNIRDEAVAPAAGLVQQWQDPQMDAVVQFWLPSANPRFRHGIDAVLARHSKRFAAWLVCESTIIANRAHPPRPGERTWGWSQSTFLAFRPDISRDDALAHWYGHHTEVAIETQANFEYRQNIVVRPLTDDAPPYDAFVEECFPPEAMNDSAAFFDAAGDTARAERNIAAMMESCAAFLDFARIDVLPTSQYCIADSGEAPG